MIENTHLGLAVPEMAEEEQEDEAFMFENLIKQIAKEVEVAAVPEEQKMEVDNEVVDLDAGQPEVIAVQG